MMASSTSKAKDHCGYNPKPQHSVCANCGAFKSELKLSRWMEQSNALLAEQGDKPRYTVEKNGVEKNLRCADHGFAVMRTATCKLWRSASVERDA